MKLEDLKDDLEKGNMDYRGVCHDCGVPVRVIAKVREDGAITIDGGCVYKITYDMDVKYFFKCDSCFKKDKTLRNYQDCEIYSRVVGYYRPITQWNKGKVAEWNMRTEFKEVEDEEISIQDTK